jgi:hypothetical protein
MHRDIHRTDRGLRSLGGYVKGFGGILSRRAEVRFMMNSADFKIVFLQARYLYELCQEQDAKWQNYLGRLEKAGANRDPDVQVLKLSL